MAEQRRSTSVRDQRAGQGSDREEDGGRRDGAPRKEDGRTKGGLGGMDAARRAKEQLEELTGHEADSVSAMSRTDDGWMIRVEMVELERVPPTTNVMGSYEVEVDRNGELASYELIRRYHRGQVGQDES